MIDLITIVNIVTAVIAASSIVLKVVAPLTKNTRDDKILTYILKGLEVLSIQTKPSK